MNKIHFCFDLDRRYMKHIANLSYYNHNYYELDFRYYGDYIIQEKCNILYEESEDDCGVSYYTLGYFDNGKFIKCFTWADEDKDLYGIEEKIYDGRESKHLVIDDLGELL